MHATGINNCVTNTILYLYNVTLQLHILQCANSHHVIISPRWQAYFPEVGNRADKKCERKKRLIVKEEQKHGHKYFP